MLLMREQWIVLLLTLLTPHVVSMAPGHCPSSGDVCYYDEVAKLLPDSKPQYFAVGGLFDIRKQGQDAFSCGTEFNPTGILHTQAFLWSLNHWQLDSDSVSIAGVVFDSCERKAQLIQNVLGFEQCNLQISGISRHNLVGFVGPTSNMAAMAAARLTGDLMLTSISPTADARMLSNAEMFPYFLRTTPTMQMDIDLMTFMLQHVETSYVAVIYQEMQVGVFHSFQERMEESRICISGSYAMTGEESSSQLAQFVRETLAGLAPTRYVALFLFPDFLSVFLDHVSADDEVKSMNLVFLMTSSIHRRSAIFNGQHAVAASDAIVLERVEPESVRNAVSEFKDYWDQDTILTAMNQTGRLYDPFLVSYLTAGNRLPAYDVDVGNTILATQAFIQGVKQAGRLAGCSPSAYLCPGFFDGDNRGDDVYLNVRTASNLFTRANGSGHFADGDLRREVMRYNIYRYNMNGTFTKIGEYTGGDRPTMDLPIRGSNAYRPGRCQDTPCPQCSDIVRTSTTFLPTTASLQPTTTPRCVPDDDDGNGNFSRVYYPYNQEITGAYMHVHRSDAEYGTRFDIGQKWIIPLGVLGGVGVVAVLAFEVYILYKLLGTRTGHKWRTMWLGQLLLFGILLCYAVLFAYIFIPTKETCAVTRFGVGFSCSVCFAVLLVKLLVILTSKTSDPSDPSQLPGDSDSPNYLKGIYQFLMFIFIIGVQAVISAQWLISVPPEAVKVVSNIGQEVWVCNHYTFKASESMNAMTDMAGFVRSEFENHVMSLVYVMVLILITTILAFKAYGIVTNHREGVFIGVAAGFSIPVWLAWTLVGGLNTDHDYAHEFGDACIAFGLFVTATLILFAMFLPKVRQLANMGVEGIYYEDDHDTVYGGSIIMAPSYKSQPGSIVYVNQGMPTDPIILADGDEVNYIKTPGSTYSAPPVYLKKGGEPAGKSGSILRVTDDLSGRRPLERKYPMSERVHGTAGRASGRGTIPRSRSQSSIGAL